MAIDYATGAATFKCVSSNPTLTLVTRGVPIRVCTAFGCTVLGYRSFDAIEVDATGAPVTGGFTCRASTTNLSTACQTRRYVSGTTIRFAATNVSDGSSVNWIDCDTVSAGICTIELNGDDFVLVEGV